MVGLGYPSSNRLVGYNYCFDGYQAVAGLGRGHTMFSYSFFHFKFLSAYGQFKGPAKRDTADTDRCKADGSKFVPKKT